jgi:hypothetical protein
VLSYQAETPADSDSNADSDVSVDSESLSDCEDITAFNSQTIDSPNNQTVESPSKFSSSKRVCSPVPHDVTAVEGATVLRRSLRKIIEESKKDAVCSDSKGNGPQPFAEGSKRTSGRKRFSAASHSEQGADVSKAFKAASEENSPMQSESDFNKKRTLSKKTKAESIKTKRSKVESRFHPAIDQTPDNGVDAIDSSEKSSVSSVGVAKKPAFNVTCRSLESRLDLTQLFGESETNSIDSDVVDPETSDSLIQSQQRKSSTSNLENDEPKKGEKLGEFLAFHGTIKQENTDCDVGTIVNGSGFIGQNLCQTTASKKDSLAGNADVPLHHCEGDEMMNDEMMNDEMAELEASTTDTKSKLKTVAASSLLHSDDSEDSKMAKSENMQFEEKLSADKLVQNDLEAPSGTSEEKLFGDVSLQVRKAADAGTTVTESKHELKQVNVDSEVTHNGEKISCELVEDSSKLECKQGNVEAPTDDMAEYCSSLTKPSMESRDDVEKIENKSEPVKEDPPEILVCQSC